MNAHRISVLMLMMTVVITSSGCALFERESADLVSIDLSKSWLEADRLNQEGVKKFEANQLRLAEANFLDALAFNPGHGGAHNNLGLMYFRRRKLAKAATHFEQAMEVMPDNPAPVNNLGMALEEAGRLFEAIEWYQQAHVMRPTSALYLGNLIRAKMRAGYDDDLITQQLKELLFYDSREEWITWAEDQLEYRARQVSGDENTEPGMATINPLPDDGVPAELPAPAAAPLIFEAPAEVPPAPINNLHIPDGNLPTVDKVPQPGLSQRTGLWSPAKPR